MPFLYVGTGFHSSADDLAAFRGIADDGLIDFREEFEGEGCDIDGNGHIGIFRIDFGQQGELLVLFRHLDRQAGQEQKACDGGAKQFSHQ
jgi:hypothetical protein